MRTTCSLHKVLSQLPTAALQKMCPAEKDQESSGTPKMQLQEEKKEKGTEERNIYVHCYVAI